MDRRTFLTTSLKAAGAGLATLSLSSIARAAGRRKPNIVYILADDLGYGDLSCFGQSRFRTPNIDRMAAEGMRFTDHYSGSTVCAPSRCTLMTGLHTGHCHVRGNREIKPEGQAPLPKGTVTVPALLKRAGYATGAFGKWGLGSPGSTGDPVFQGFDTFYGYNCQRQAHNYYPTHLWHDRKKVPLDGKTYSHDLIVEQALSFIRANKARPFFCYMPVTIPHAAMHVPEKYVAPFRRIFPQFEKTIGRYAGPQVRNPIAAFAGMVTKLDEDVGRVLALLKELAIDEDTIVLFTSDNGPHKEGGHNPAFFRSNDGLRGIKRDVYEGGIRVPLIARGPGRVPRGATTPLPSAFWDFLPTACELAGAASPRGIDGISYAPTLTGARARQKRHEYLYWEFPSRGGKRAVRAGNWKGVQLDVKKTPNGPIEVYDLKEDPAEKRDLAGRFPGVAAQFRRFFAEAHTASKLFPLLKEE